MPSRIVIKLHNHTLVQNVRGFLHRHHYSTPLFVWRETLAGFRRHNSFNTAAALSFYALFALIPMVLLMFFLLSHLVVSSNSAIVKLTALTGNMMPKFSHRIMIEVFNISKHRAVWGVFGVIAMLSASLPLANALRTTFHNITAIPETPAFLRSKLQDLLVVVGILLLFFMFSFSGLMVEKLLLHFHLRGFLGATANTLATLLVSSLLLSAFYRAFFPGEVRFTHILAGSLLTAALWMAMRPALGLFLLFNQSYGTIFGGLKNMMLSIGWLYYGFAVFLMGTELIATLRKKNILLFKGLFHGIPHDRELYLRKLTDLHGKHYSQGQYLFRAGHDDHDLYYVAEGTIAITRNGELQREIGAGEYCGEIAFLTDEPRTADACIISDHAEIVVISAASLESLLQEEPGVAMTLLREIASRLRHNLAPGQS